MSWLNGYQEEKEARISLAKHLIPKDTSLICILGGNWVLYADEDGTVKALDLDDKRA